jgi:zinc/manganese transport system permease protein
MIFLSLLVINLLCSFHALGTLLAVALMMLPAITAMFWTQHLLTSMALAMFAGLISSWAGLWLSFALDTPTGPTIVLVAGNIMLISMVFGRVKGIIWRYVRQHHHKA